MRPSRADGARPATARTPPTSRASSTPREDAVRRLPQQGRRGDRPQGCPQAGGGEVHHLPQSSRRWREGSAGQGQRRAVPVVSREACGGGEAQGRPRPLRCQRLRRLPQSSRVEGAEAVERRGADLAIAATATRRSSTAPMSTVPYRPVSAPPATAPTRPTTRASRQARGGMPDLPGGCWLRSRQQDPRPVEGSAATATPRQRHALPRLARGQPVRPATRRSRGKDGEERSSPALDCAACHDAHGGPHKASSRRRRSCARPVTMSLTLKKPAPASTPAARGACNATGYD
jgi:hypothetical protein